MTAKQYHHGDLKASLIKAANDILQREGAEALSLRAIAAEVGVSHMAPYAHFKNKQELLKGVVEAGFVKMATSMECCVENSDAEPLPPMELVLAYGASYLEFAMANPQLYRLMLGQVETQGRKSKSDKSGDDEITSSFTENSNRPFVLLRAAFAQLDNNEDKVKARALGAWSMVHGMAALMLEGHIRVPEGLTLKQFLASASALPELKATKKAGITL